MYTRRILGAVSAGAALIAALLAPGVSAAGVAQPSGWDKVALPTGGHSIYSLGHVDFTDTEHGWIFGSVNMGANKTARSALWLTADGGSSWTLRWTRTSQSPGAATVADATHGWYATDDGNSADVYGTSDAGRSWKLEARLPGDVVSMTSINSTHAWLSGNSGFLAATTDGRRWHPLASPTTNFADSMQFLNLFDGWLVDGIGHLYTTGDGGRTWTRLIRVGADPYAQVDFVNLAVGWSSAYQGLYHSTNGGRTWSRQLATPPDDLGPIHFSSTSRGWIVDGKSTLRTSDGGQDWTSYAAPAANLTWITSTPAGDEWTVGPAAYRYAHGA